MNVSKKIGPVRVRQRLIKGVPTGTWFVDIPASLTSTSKRKRKLFDSCKSAEQHARLLKERLELRQMGIWNKPPSGISFLALYEKWKVHDVLVVETGEKRQRSHDTDCFRAKPLIRAFGTQDASLITEDGVLSYRHTRQVSDGCAPETVNGELRTLRKILRWGVPRGFVGKVPPIPLKRQKPSREPLPTPEQVARLIEWVPKAVRPLVWLMAETGCRPSEAYNLRWADIDLMKRTVSFLGREDWQPKTTSSERVLFITEQLAEYLRQVDHKGVYVYSRTGKSPVGTIRKTLLTAARAAKLPTNLKITPKVLRKAYATREVLRKTPIPVVKGNLGHSPESNILERHYARIADEQRREFLSPLPVELPVPELAISGKGSGKKAGRPKATSGNKQRQIKHSENGAPGETRTHDL